MDLRELTAQVEHVSRDGNWQILKCGSPGAISLTKVRDMDTEAVAQVRRFNRTVTQRVGALQDRFLGRARPLGEARLLWEIGADGRYVRSLRVDLGLDSGYLSRMLRSLERDGLVTLETDPDDRRVRVARRTAAGHAEQQALDRHSDLAAEELLAPLGPAQRTRLLAAMADVERLLRASAVEIAEADAEHPDVRRCLRTYYAELDARFEGGFDAVASYPDPGPQFRPPHGLFLVARLGAEAVGCAGLLFPDAQVAEIKRMWVSQRVRGGGLGRRLLGELEARAAARGARSVRLDTNRALTEAITMYRSAGYADTTPFNADPWVHHWFEKRLG